MSSQFQEMITKRILVCSYSFIWWSIDSFLVLNTFTESRQAIRFANTFSNSIDKVWISLKEGILAQDIKCQSSGNYTGLKRSLPTKKWCTQMHFHLLLLKMQTTSQPKKLAPLRSQAGRSKDTMDGEHTPKKGRKFLKSILSRRKSRKDEPLPSYFDDYWAFTTRLGGTTIWVYLYTPPAVFSDKVVSVLNIFFWT